jgi:hypothetical protein
LGLFFVFWKREMRPRAAFMLAFLTFSFATACPGLLFREHYFIPMLAAVALLAGAAAQAANLLIGNRLPYWIFAAAVVFPFFSQRDLYFSMTPAAAAVEIWGEDNPFPEAVSAASFIRTHTAPNTLVAVLGSEPEIYFYAHRHSATPYIYMYGLMEAQLYALKMQNDVIRDIENVRPQYIVDVDSPYSWLVRDDSATRIFDWWDEYRSQYYQLSVSFGNLSIYRRKP